MSKLPKTKQAAVAAGLNRYFTGKPCVRGHVAQRSTYKANCVVCHDLAIKAWGLKNKERKKIVQKEYRRRSRVYIRSWHELRRKSLKRDALKAYGNKCACCYEQVPEFLTIDHIDGGGRIHRKQIGSATYQWLKKHNYPPGFRVLCFGCNFAFHVFGICPHQQRMPYLELV